MTKTKCPMCLGYYGDHDRMCVLYAQAAPPPGVTAQSYDFRGIPARAAGLFAEPKATATAHPVSGVPYATTKAYAVTCAGCGETGTCVCKDAPTALSPSHYTRLDPQPIDVIAAWGLNFNLGNVVKYVARAGYKGHAQFGLITDLKKAADYLAREIARHEKESSK